jgi:hypothetical protein
MDWKERASGLFPVTKMCSHQLPSLKSFIGIAYQGKDIVFRFIIEYSSLRDFWPLGNNNRSIFM